MKLRLIQQGIACAAVALGLDWLSKWVMLEKIDLLNRPPIEVTGFFNLAAVWNQGISFGMFASHNQPLILIVLSLIIMGVLGLWLIRADSRFIACALGLVIGGAMGNVLDRIRFGKVFDFLDFHISGLHWPAFNIADSSIFIGVVLLCIHSMFLEKRHISEGKPE